MAKKPEFLILTDRAEWRSWLNHNHQTKTEIWLLHHKKRFSGPTIPLEEAVEEALCFGWIDSTLLPHDEKTYLHRYTPRRPNSIWSISNINRANKLIQAGLMTEAGLAKIQEAQENGQWEAAFKRENVDVIPPELETALRSHPGALESYQELRTSRKKQLLYWLQSAKRPETVKRRIEAILKDVRSDHTSDQDQT
jgi:uncharacterized protein YdeI (YjbR/CyaY-like superfamily)